MAYLSKPTKKKKTDNKTPTPTGAITCACGCGATNLLLIHHVFYGNGKRKLSNRFKCVDWLTYEHHQGDCGIHGSKEPDTELDHKLKAKHQKRLTDNGMDIETFIHIFGRNYIEG